MHDVVQIDEFTVLGAWVGGSLQFSDDDRHSRCETPRPGSRHPR